MKSQFKEKSPPSLKITSQRHNIFYSNHENQSALKFRIRSILPQDFTAFGEKAETKTKYI